MTTRDERIEAHARRVAAEAPEDCGDCGRRLDRGRCYGCRPGNPAGVNHAPGGWNGRAKLRPADVPRVKARHAETGSPAAVAREFGVTKGTVCRVVSGRSWAEAGAAEGGGS